MMKYDLCIVGGGAAGLSAAINAASEGLTTVVIEGGQLGGQVIGSSAVENLLGYSEITGFDLVQRALAQCDKFGVQFIRGHAQRLLTDGRTYFIEVGGVLVEATNVLIATGLSHRKLDMVSDDCKIYYGTPYIQPYPKSVAVVGGANSAGQAAVHLSKNCDEVVLIHRGFWDGMSNYLLDRIMNTANITLVPNDEIIGVNPLTLKSGLTLHQISAIVCFIGSEPKTDWLPKDILDDRGYVVTNDRHETVLSGVFAAGDIRAGSIKRVASAVGEGSRAVHYIHQWRKERGL